MKKLILLFITATLGLDAVNVASMSTDEQKACGIEKLSLEERTALDSWLEKQMPAPKPAHIAQLHKSKIQHGQFSVTENTKLGRFITLDNGVIYDIPSRSRKKTMGWKVGDKVSLVEPIYPTNYKLENVAQKQTIGAKIATSKKAIPDVNKPE
ncbi:MAG: hypothetical protein LLF94_10615 [Chlamydiales bacterium]|nr:hypothetical protein [Chlamydiales bacterium]